MSCVAQRVAGASFGAVEGCGAVVVIPLSFFPQ